jgi:hypothetical protein
MARVTGDEQIMPVKNAGVTCQVSGNDQRKTTHAVVRSETVIRENCSAPAA